MPTPSDHALAADHVSFAYGDVPALMDVALTLRPGMMLALTGPNGSGKTTLLRLLTGELAPASGAVCLHGRPLARFSARERARHIAVVPQHIDATMALTVRVLVAMGRTPYVNLFGTLDEADEQAIRNALRATETEGLSDRRFDELSGGEQQRVAVAVALAQGTPFLLLDEPTVHLDLHHQFELLELLRRLRSERNLGILAVLHDLNLAALYFDHLAVLDSGRQVAAGTPSEVMSEAELGRVFRAPLRVVTHPDLNAPQVLLRPSRPT